MKKKKFTIGRFFMYALLILLAVSFLYPLVFMFSNSLKTQTQYMQDVFSFPWEDPKFENYVSIFNSFKIGKYLINTLFVTVVKLAIMIPLALCASYAFAKLRFKGKRVMYPAVISVMFIPFTVIMIPLYVMMSKVHLINTYLGYILVCVATGTAGTIMMLTSYLYSIPNDVLEAAKLDGSGYFRTVFGIVLPMSKPIIAISVVMSFIGSWNDVLAPMVMLKSEDKQLVMPALNRLVGQYSKDIPLQLAGILIATVPAILIYVLLQKQIIMGITDGAVKN